MKTNLFALLLPVLVLLGCGSTPVKAPVSTIPADTTYLVDAINVNLTQAIQVEGYPDQAAFTKILTDKTLEALKKNNLLAQSGSDAHMSATINVNYHRNFAGDATPMPSKSVVAPTLDFTIIINKDGVEQSRIHRSGLTTSKGLAGNLVTVFTMGLGNDAKDELLDIQKLANTIASELSAARQNGKTLF